MGKLKSAITDINGNIVKMMPTEISVPKVRKIDAVKTVARGVKATGQGTIFAAAKTVRTGRDLGKAFSSFYSAVKEEMARQDEPSEADKILAKHRPYPH